MVDAEIGRDLSVGTIGAALQLALDQALHLRTRQVPTMDVLADRKALFLGLAQSGADDHGRRLVSLQFAPGAKAMVAVEDRARLVDVDRRDNPTGRDVRLQRRELLGRHGRHELIRRRRESLGSDCDRLELAGSVY